MTLATGDPFSDAPTKAQRVITAATNAVKDTATAAVTTVDRIADSIVSNPDIPDDEKRSFGDISTAS